MCKLNNKRFQYAVAQFAKVDLFPSNDDDMKFFDLPSNDVEISDLEVQGEHHPII